MIAIGTRLGGYEVLAPIGVGAMGEVYRARDLRLGRDVAVKILPPAFSADPERVVRFAREARALAALNHPHVAAIYGFEEDRDIRAIVLELVDGPTLSERIATGPLTVGQATAIAREIADALDAAHEKGIIHRDLKPSNIKLTPGGAVKVLDFGLAKAMDGEQNSGRQLEPTLTEIGTGAGVILGTVAYMSPEQARGQPLDKRTDIWAFGCVVFELLTGRSPFLGATPSDTLSAILDREPDWNALPPDAPVQVRALIRRCLEKDVRRRLRDIGDARFELDGPAGPAAASHTPAPVQRWARRLGMAAVVATGLAVGAWGWSLAGEGTPAEPVYVTIRLPRGAAITRGPQYASSVALSPNGRLLVIAGSTAGGQMLYKRPLDRLDAAPIPGTEGGSSPFFSPDGAWIGFFAADRLRRVPVDGGAAVDITTSTTPLVPRGAAWLPDGRIVFASGGFPAMQLVDARGGTPQPLTTLDNASGESGHADPVVLPDGRTLLFGVRRRGRDSIETLDLADGKRTRIVEGSVARYAASGQLVVGRGTNLLGARFDPARLTVDGPIVPLVEGIATESTGAWHFTISSSGVLAYVPAAREHALSIVDANGRERSIGEELAEYENPQFSGGGDRVVVAARRRGDATTNLWVQDLRAGILSRLTSDGGRAAVWTPDDTAVTYSHLGEQPGIYTIQADGRGSATRVVTIDSFHWLVGWTPDGRTLAYGVMDAVRPDGNSQSSIMALTEGQPRRVVGPGNTWGGRLSPDGRWLVYYELEPPGFEVYVTSFPDGGARWLIADGTDPAWSPDGGEIYYRSGDRLVAARLDTGSGVRVVSRRVVVEPFLPPQYDDYDVHPDGRTIAMVRPVGDAVGREVALILGWFGELNRLTRSP